MMNLMEDFDSFVSKYPSKQYQKGAMILHQGEIPSHAFVVKSGFVKVYNITAQGEERPVLFDLTYEVFPIGWVFGKIKRAYFYYEAFTDAVIYSIPCEDYIRFLKNDPEMMWQALDYYVDRHVSYQLRMHALEQSKACDKILYTLEFLCRRFGQEPPEQDVKLILPLTQQDFANFVGLTRETTATELKKLQRQGVISYSNQTYTIHTPKLKAILDEK